ncbi:MAG: low molecular weight phosphotyrosine protein phosphatase [Gammaproteobacteria bacterium]|nr:low molecular weight phosphotyrosine protein phosphatase [Gammaproteobacteria bacterium]
MSTDKPISVLFICMGNICRSPTAEGVFRKVVNDAGLAELIHIESAGTHAYHVNDPPDRRALTAAERRGISLAGIRARRVDPADFERFDYIFAMDRDNLQLLIEEAGGKGRAQIALFLEYATGGRESEVPDPYYGGAAGFERVLDLVEDASASLLDILRSRLP